MGFFSSAKDKLIHILYGMPEELMPPVEAPKEQIQREINERIADIYHVSPRDLEVEIEHSDLPVIHYFERIGDAIYHTVGKILGYFDPENIHRIGIDQSLLENYWNSLHSQKEYWKAYSEEVIHKAQKLTGKLNDRYKDFKEYFKHYSKDPIENEAKMYTNDIVDSVLGSRQNYLSLYS
jgi:hypothetical protein